MPLNGLYGESIMDHYRNPRNRHPVDAPDIEAHEFNPFCGDEVTLRIKLDDAGRVLATSAQSEGCSIIQAAASMLAREMEGKTLEEVLELARSLRSMMRGHDEYDESSGELGDLKALQVVRQYPVRIKCALLPLTALEEGIKAFHSRNGTEPKG